MVEVLEHLGGNPTWAMEEINRSCNPGAMIVISTPSVLKWGVLEDNRHWSKMPVTQSRYDTRPEHSKHWAPREIVHLLTHFGWTDIQTYTYREDKQIMATARRPT
jgi:2-polyprenyl-3-methyl-5-hydroxy-6-metoxy-1,4-benzoquinol methylase